MSLGNFFKNLFENIVDFFRKIPDELQNAIHVGVLVVENLKRAIDSPVVDLLTSIIPSDADDTVKDKLREWLPKILMQLKLVEECSGLTDPDEIVACALRTIQQMEGDFKSAFLHNISVLIAQKVSHTNLSWSIGVYLTQWYYDHKFEAQ